jgi:hypothetical protein
MYAKRATRNIFPSHLSKAPDSARTTYCLPTFEDVYNRAESPLPNGRELCRRHG